MSDQAAQWRRVEQLCAAALERAEVERAAFLRDDAATTRDSGARWSSCWRKSPGPTDSWTDGSRP